MAQVIATITRPSIEVELYRHTVAERSYSQSYYNLLVGTLELVEPYEEDTGRHRIHIIKKIGPLSVCQAYYNELHDPTSIYNRRREYYAANNISYTIELIEDSET